MFSSGAESDALYQRLLEEPFLLGNNTRVNLPPTSSQFLLGANAFYLLFTWGLYRVVKAQPGLLKCVKFRSILLAYNLTCIAAAGYVAVGVVYVVCTTKLLFVCNQTLIAGDERNDGHFEMFMHFVSVFYLQKFWEFLDTWIYIGRQSFRQVTFLHIYHHCSINIVVATMLSDYEHSIDSYLAVLLNSIVHLLMYIHYLVTSLGLPAPWKPYLTSVQLLQFIAIFAQSCIAITRGDSCNSGLSRQYHCLMLVYMISMAVLFGDFFLRTYILNASRATQKLR